MMELARRFLIATTVVLFMVSAGDCRPSQTSKSTPAVRRPKSGAPPAARDNPLDGCICGIDEARRTVTVVPWNKSAKFWDVSKTRRFVFRDQTTIEGETKATVAELKNGTVIKSFHLTGMSMSGVSGAPFEIKTLSQCLHRRTTLRWSGVKGISIANRIELPYLFAGETMPAMVGDQGASLAGSDDCPCRSSR